ncbi:MAG TPA: sugar phosphate nucleotidyltransferase [Patescibacteria group bacterium]|nr:sugar phosphate nucleotidyltransferase [Patescibacteria group bacterium]
MYKFWIPAPAGMTEGGCFVEFRNSKQVGCQKEEQNDTIAYMAFNMVILAGGHGTRLWPVSRKGAPKQVQPFLDTDTLLQKTIKRFEPVIDPENIFISTHSQYKDLIVSQVEGIDKQNIICEPTRKDNAPAICFAAMTIAERDPDGLIGICGSDAYIAHEDCYQDILRSIPDILAVDPNDGVILGVVPKYAETGYGYIEYDMSNIKYHILNTCVYTVKRFIEKPDAKTAEDYIKRGNFLWNPLQFFFTVKQLLALYEQLAPEIYHGVHAMMEVDDEDTKRDMYNALPAISIDYAIMEKTQDLLVIPADIGWLDIGHWRAVQDILSSSPSPKGGDTPLTSSSYQGESFLTPSPYQGEGREGSWDTIVKGKHIGVDTQRSLIYSEASRLIATIGISDMIVIDTPDALLICPKDQAQRVKELVKKMQDEGLEEYL